jgi:hypothetical protein
MIAGLPWESWLLLLVSVGAGLWLVAAFHLRHRGDRRRRRRPDDGGLRGGGSHDGSRGGSRGGGPHDGSRGGGT